MNKPHKKLSSHDQGFTSVKVMSMIADKILNKLESVKQTGQDRWIAKCPAHDDRSPSLAIREVDDRLLIHCFAGCGVHNVVSSVGLEISDLFPERKDTSKGGKSISKPFPAADILHCLTQESLFVLLCAEAMRRGESLQAWDHGRLLQTASRFRAALSAGRLS